MSFIPVLSAAVYDGRASAQNLAVVLLTQMIPSLSYVQTKSRRFYGYCLCSNLGQKCHPL